MQSRVSAESAPYDANRVRREQLTLVHNAMIFQKRNANRRDILRSFRVWAENETQPLVVNQKDTPFFSVFLRKMDVVPD